MKLPNRLSAAVLATVLLLGPGTASALTVNETSPGSGIATDIEDLDVGGTLYDVLFRETNTAPAVYGGIYPGDQAFASAAAQAINTALQNAGIDTVGPSVGDNDNEYLIGWANDLTQVEAAVSGKPGLNLWTFLGDGSFALSVTAHFAEISQVPEPAAAWLLGSCLIGLIRSCSKQDSMTLER